MSYLFFVMKAKEITKKIHALKLTEEVIESWSEDFPFSIDTPYDLDDIIEADTPQKINEASLGRGYQHYKNSGKTSWAILTSWRQDLTDKENYANLKKLKTRIKIWSYFRLIGHGQEDDKEGTIVSVEEPSFFVIGIPLEEALEIAKKFKQFAITYSGPETNQEVWIVQQDGSVKDSDKMKDFHPGKISKFYSQVRGRPFFFESIAESWIEGVWRERHEAIPVEGVRRQSWRWGGRK